MTQVVLPAPLAVWDCNDRLGLWQRNMLEASQWAVEHLPNRGVLCYRAEFHLIDIPFVVIYEYAVDTFGKVIPDPETGQLALMPPRTVMLADLPPRHLLEEPS